MLESCFQMCLRAFETFWCATILSIWRQVLILRNHGVVVCGETVEETYLLLDFFMIACQSQVAMMAAGVDQLAQVSSVAFENMIKVCGSTCQRNSYTSSDRQRKTDAR